MRSDTQKIVITVKAEMMGRDGGQLDSFLIGPRKPGEGMVWLSKLHTEIQENKGNERRKWSRSWESLLCCISLSVGLGTIWRFPFTAMDNGGGAFLLVYTAAVCVLGYPIYFLELALGQFCSGDPVKIWDLSPIFKGVGYATLMALFVQMTYHCALVVIPIFYLFSSFQSPLPWTLCERNETCPQDLTAHYYKNIVLNEAPDILEGIGMPDLKLASCLLGFWIFLYGAMTRGVQSIGKVAYVTATLPLVILVILLAHCLTLPGSTEGIRHFLTPTWTAFLSSDIWYAAVGQLLFSLFITHGPTIMYGGRNKFSHNAARDAGIVCLFHLTISLLAGFLAFSAIGIWSVQAQVPIHEVMRVKGMAYAFQTFLLVISKVMAASQFFAILFFMLLVIVGLGNGMSVVTILIFIQEKWPKFQNGYVLPILFCFTAFLLGLPYVTPGGQLLMLLVDDHIGLVILIMGSLQLMGICWCYGVTNLTRDIEYMQGGKISYYMKVCWKILAPASLLLLLTRTLLNWTPVENTYPPIASYFAWILTGIGIIIFVGGATHSVFSDTTGSSFMGRLEHAARPSSKWGPHRAWNRKRWEALS